MLGPWGDFFGRNMEQVHDRLVEVQLPGADRPFIVYVHERVVPALEQVIANLEREAAAGRRYTIRADYTWSYNPITIPRDAALLVPHGGGRHRHQLQHQPVPGGQRPGDRHAGLVRGGLDRRGLVLGRQLAGGQGPHALLLAGAPPHPGVPGPFPLPPSDRGRALPGRRLRHRAGGGAGRVRPPGGRCRPRRCARRGAPQGVDPLRAPRRGGRRLRARLRDLPAARHHRAAAAGQGGYRPGRLDRGRPAGPVGLRRGSARPCGSRSTGGRPGTAGGWCVPAVPTDRAARLPGRRLRPGRACRSVRGPGRLAREGRGVGRAPVRPFAGRAPTSTRRLPGRPAGPRATTTWTGCPTCTCLPPGTRPPCGSPSGARAFALEGPMGTSVADPSREHPPGGRLRRRRPGGPGVLRRRRAWSRVPRR